MLILLLILGLMFSALAIWQLERRTQKVALIAAVNGRSHAAPEPAPEPARWPGVTFNHDSYRAVEARGQYLRGEDTLVQAVSERGPGFWVITPLRTRMGWIVLVNRGFVENRTAEGAPPGGPVTLTGLLRISEPGGGFLHSNDPRADRWYSRDVAAIARARHLSNVAPYFIDAGPSGISGQPIGGLTVVSFPNNHLQYAVTWAALAVLSLFGAVRAWRSR